MFYNANTPIPFSSDFFTSSLGLVKLFKIILLLDRYDAQICSQSYIPYWFS